MKRILTLIMAFLLMFSFCIMPVSADETDDYTTDDLLVYENESLPRLVDDYDLLTYSEEEEITAKLDSISEKHSCDVVIVTVYSLDGKSAMEYADDFYDYNGYGFGDSSDGILLLVSMEYRDYWITTTGSAITAFTDAGLDYIEDDFVSYLSDGDYYTAFDIFAEDCDKFLTQAETDEPYDYGNMPKEPMNIPLWILISLALASLVTCIPMGILRAQIKNVRSKANASDYVKQGSMSLTESRDQFLYRHVDRRLKPQNSGGGSSTHFGSSGTSHGGSGGKF